MVQRSHPIIATKRVVENGFLKYVPGSLVESLEDAKKYGFTDEVEEVEVTTTETTTVTEPEAPKKRRGRKPGQKRAVAPQHTEAVTPEDDRSEDDGVPAKTATKAEWVAYAVSQGVDEEEANALNLPDLAAKYGKG